MNAFDLVIFEWFNGLALRWPWFDTAIILMGKKLPYAVGAAFALLFLLPILPRFRDHARKNLEMLFVALGGALVVRFVVTEVIRYFYNRPRPFQIVADAHQLISHEGGGSFPSGHAVFFFALAAGIWPYYRKTSITFFATALVISVSRVVGGVHWPSDIIAGAALGIGTAWIVAVLVRRFAGR